MNCIEEKRESFLNGMVFMGVVAFVFLLIVIVFTSACTDSIEPDLITDPVNEMAYTALSPLTFTAPEGSLMRIEMPDGMIYDNIVKISFHEPEFGLCKITILYEGEIPVESGGMSIRINGSCSKYISIEDDPFWNYGPYEFEVIWVEHTASNNTR